MVFKPTKKKVRQNLVDAPNETEKSKGKTHWASGELVRPLSCMEILTSTGGFYDNLTTVQAIWLKSKVPILQDHVKQALDTLSRKIPLLRFCVDKVGGRLWFKKMVNFTLDFESSTDEVSIIYNDILSRGFNMSEGPLWRVRIVYPNGNEKSENERYVAVLVFGVQHCITDGTTNMRICRETVQIVNDLIKGKEIISEVTQLGPVIDNNIRDPMSLKFITKVAMEKLTGSLLQNYNKKSSFKGSFPIPRTKTPHTKVLFDSLSVSDTRELLKRCKMEEITVHSCIVTATNFTLLQCAQARKQSKIGSQLLNVSHCVNIRKYLGEQYLNADGCHISVMDKKSRVSLDDFKNFWSSAKCEHTSMKVLLDVEKLPIKVIPILPLATIVYSTNSLLTKRGMKHRTDCHYMTTNMGNLKHMLPEPEHGDSIEITNILRSVSMQHMGNPFLLTFHTFRGAFMISMDYFTAKMTDDVAAELFKVLCANIRNLAVNACLLEISK